jgi:hypothetical protein
MDERGHVMKNFSSEPSNWHVESGRFLVRRGKPDRTEDRHRRPEVHRPDAERRTSQGPTLLERHNGICRMGASSIAVARRLGVKDGEGPTLDLTGGQR